jgi:hypothetical protein
VHGSLAERLGNWRTAEVLDTARHEQRITHDTHACRPFRGDDGNARETAIVRITLARGVGRLLNPQR